MVEAPGRKWLYINIPLMSYSEAWQLQKRIAEARAHGRLQQDALLLLEHPSVFTLGRRGGEDNLQVPRSMLEQSGVEIHEIERGGNITYHGPGQLVAYPIVHLRENRMKVVDFVNALEEIMLRTAADWDVRAVRDERNRGIWIGDNKLGALGIAVRRSVSYHGFALNVNLSLEHFKWINPCGLQGVGVTTMARELGREVPMNEVREAARRHFEDVCRIKTEAGDLDSLEKLL